MNYVHHWFWRNWLRGPNQKNMLSRSLLISPNLSKMACINVILDKM